MLERVWEAYLQQIGITGSRHIRIATEGALTGSLLAHGFPATMQDSSMYSAMRCAGYTPSATSTNSCRSIPPTPNTSTGCAAKFGTCTLTLRRTRPTQACKRRCFRRKSTSTSMRCAAPARITRPSTSTSNA